MSIAPTDLLTPREEADRANVFDIPLLASRLIAAAEWTASAEQTRGLPIGLFGASTGAAAALVAAARLGDKIAAVVSRGGRPDLAAAALEQATRDDRIQLDGSPSLIREFPTWNARSMFAHIRPVSGTATTPQAGIRQRSFA